MPLRLVKKESSRNWSIEKRWWN